MTLPLEEWAAAVLACPHCRGPLRAVDRAVVCAAGHEAGTVTDGILSFTRPRSGVGGRLVSFWSGSSEYYRTARELNVDYDDEAHASHRQVIGALAGGDVRRVLDVGCGTGELAAELEARVGGREYVGVDVSPLAVRGARELGRPGAFVAADAERLPFRDASFDAVVSFYALEHFTDPRDSLAEMVRVLRPGGLLGLLSLSFDRPWGTIPSLRLGLVWRGRKLPRLHPANLAVYAVNRLRFAVRQAAKRARYLLDPAYESFEVVSRPLVLEAGYQPDLDAVHVVSGESVLRLLERSGLEVVDTSVVRGAAGAVRIPFDLRIVARKGPGADASMIGADVRDPGTRGGRP